MQLFLDNFVYKKNINKVSKVWSFYDHFGIKEKTENKIKDLNTLILDLVSEINIKSTRKKVQKLQ